MFSDNEQINTLIKMNPYMNIFDEAVYKLEQLTGLPVKFDIVEDTVDGLLNIQQVQFAVMIKTEIRSSNKGIVLSQLMDLKSRTTRPVILVSGYIAAEIAEELKNRQINYVDMAGNCSIKHKDLFIFIHGQKARRPLRTYRARAFQEAGIKLIFNLLRDPRNLQLSYRDQAGLCDISVGSVSNILGELEDLDFLLRSKNRRILKNTRQLLHRWITAYFDVLRPRLIKKRMRFSFAEDRLGWSDLPINEINGTTLWGSEPAVAILTQTLNPDKFTIYTSAGWMEVAKVLRLVPDESGNIEILSIFWKDHTLQKSNLVPVLLIYADLIGSGIERNIQIANDIFKDELHYIK